MNVTSRRLADCAASLHELARRKTGLNDFGDPAYRHGLHALLVAYDRDYILTDAARLGVRREIVDILIGRLYAHRGWAEHPEVLTAPIHRPLFITGFPRTGTTALHRLLSADPQFQGLESWLTTTPMVRPPRETWDTLPEYRAFVAKLEAFYAHAPGMRQAHDVVANEVEECIPLLAQSFVSTVLGSVVYLPTYESWLETQSALGTYRYHANVLRLIGAREPEKRWLLKSPVHMVEIDALLDVYPDACIIVTHRDPLKVIPSLCSLLQLQLPRNVVEAGQYPEIGPRMCGYWRKALDRMQAACQRFPERFFQVDHRRFRTDPMSTVHSIYDRFSLTLSAYAEERMHAWIAADPTSKHGEHKYAVDAWGITPAQICEIFSDYRAQHGFA